MKIKLGKNNTGFGSVITSVTNFDDVKMKEIVISDISDDGIICHPDAVNTGSIISEGITLTVDSDDLSFALATITDDTDGKYSLAKLLRTMIKLYPDCIDVDDLFSSAAVLIKECKRRVPVEAKAERSVLKAASAMLESYDDNCW